MHKENLKSFFSDYWKMQPSAVHDDLAFDNDGIPQYSSLKMFQFFSAVEKKFNARLTNINKIMTFRDLAENLHPKQ